MKWFVGNMEVPPVLATGFAKAYAPINPVPGDLYVRTEWRQIQISQATQTEDRSPETHSRIAEAPGKSTQVSVGRNLRVGNHRSDPHLPLHR